MLFNSFQFLIFFPIVTLVFFVVPKKIRYIWLLLASYYFYMCWNAKYALLLFFSTAITWLSAVIMEWLGQSAYTEEKIRFGKKCCVAASFILNLFVLFFFKYFDFAVDNLNRILEHLQLRILSPGMNIILPVGISFYIFQALGYTVDVYRGEIQVEKNPARYALFVSFFPQLVAGPIERSQNLLLQMRKIEQIKVWNYERIKNGLLLMIWGFFQKLVIADRIAILTDNIFDYYAEYGMVELLTAAMLFSFQIYCDFGGYSLIAKGCAQIMGFELMDNFRQPYLAMDIKDFWRRWHISLTTWFTDYVYIPLGGNRKGRKVQCRNILIVFLSSGLWHGANWTYVIWGFLHGLTQVIDNIWKWLGLQRQILHRRYLQVLVRILKTGITFGVVTIYWIFFRADSLTDALAYLKQCTKVLRRHTFVDMGLSKGNWIVLLLALLILFAVDIIHERKIHIRALIEKQNLVIKGFIYLAAVWIVILFGVYGFQYDASQFIYFQF